jgi:hypothetical protein
MRPFALMGVRHTFDTRNQIHFHLNVPDLPGALPFMVGESSSSISIVVYFRKGTVRVPQLKNYTMNLKDNLDTSRLEKAAAAFPLGCIFVRGRCECPNEKTNDNKFCK